MPAGRRSEQLAALFEDEVRARMLGQARLAAWLGMLLYPAYGPLDLLVMGEHGPLFVGIRLATVPVLYAVVRASRLARAHRRAYLLAAVVPASIGLGLAVMMRFGGGYATPYFWAPCLLAFGVGVLYPWPVRWALSCNAALWASYAVPALLLDGIADASTFALANSLYAGTTIISVYSSYHLWRAMRHDFQQRQQLLENDRLKSEFLANVSHELRTPLALNRAPLRTLLAGEAGPLTARQRELLEVMERNGARLARLVDDLLELARLEAGRRRTERRSLDLVAALRLLAAQFESAFSAKGLQLRLELPAEPVPAVLDPAAFDRILYNLLGNALKFTERGGATLRLLRREGMHVIEVEDSGPGIPAEQIPLAFERFRQLDGTMSRHHEGTGIGLALARDLAREMGGELQCESTVGRGSTFRLLLPASAPAPPPEERPAAEAAEPARALGAGAPAAAPAAPPAALTPPAGLAPAAVWREHGAGPQAPHLLVVEDHAELGHYVASLFVGHYRVSWCRTAAQALALLEEEVPDAIVSDVMLPHMSGIELCRAVRARPALRAVGILLLTARAGPQDMVAGLEAGADDYLGKPFEPEVLRSKVGVMLRLKRLREELLAAERRASAARLVVALKHELNNALAALLGTAELLELELPALPPAAREPIATMTRQARRIAEALRGLDTLDVEATVPYAAGLEMYDLNRRRRSATSPEPN